MIFLECVKPQLPGSYSLEDLGRGCYWRCLEEPLLSGPQSGGLRQERGSVEGVLRSHNCPGLLVGRLRQEGAVLSSGCLVLNLSEAGGRCSGDGVRLPPKVSSGGSNQ